MNISINGIKLISAFESCKLKAYLDLGGLPTIGYGTTHYYDDRRVEMGDEISMFDAEYYLKEECNSIANRLSKLLIVEINQNQVDSLVSLIYNIGFTAFKSSSLLAYINTRNPIDIGLFTKWDKIHRDGYLVAIPGLKLRRIKEFELFTKTID